MPEALKDAEEAIKMDPSFIKAYIRKALTQQAMKDLTGSLETLQKATEMDVDKKVCSPWRSLKLINAQHTRELETNMSKVMMELQSQRAGESDEQTYERAMRDPEVQQIMGTQCGSTGNSFSIDLADPLMRQILSDSQQDPRALSDHMKNPMVRQDHM